MTSILLLSPSERSPTSHSTQRFPGPIRSGGGTAFSKGAPVGKFVPDHHIVFITAVIAVIQGEGNRRSGVDFGFILGR